MPSLGNFHSLERKIWPQWGDRLGEKFPTDANQLVELCHPGGSTLRTGLCEPNRNSEPWIPPKCVPGLSIKRMRAVAQEVCVCRGVYAYVCLWWECVYVWWGCVGGECMCVCVVRMCVCMYMVRVCVCVCGEDMCVLYGCVCVCVCVMRGPGNEMKGSYFLILIRVRK